MLLLAWKHVDGYEAIGGSASGLVSLVLMVEWDVKAGGRIVSAVVVLLGGVCMCARLEDLLLKTTLPSAFGRMTISVGIGSHIVWLNYPI